MISPLGGTEHRLAEIAAEGQMSWSPDGKWLAVATTDPGGGTAIPGSGLILVSTDGGESRQITHPKPPALDSAPAFSRSARLLAYASCTGGETCDIYVQQFDAAYAKQGSARRITNQGILIRSLAWSADEASLIYEGAVTMTENRIWQVSLQGQSAPQRLEIAGASAHTPAIAAKGKHLAFSRRLANYDIWRYHVGGSMEPFLVSSLTDFEPAFSPDGRKIAFSSDRSGEEAEIWVANADGSGPVSLTSHFGRHQGSPEWSPDGRWIAFDSLGRDGTWRAYVVAATGGRPRRITSDAVDENVPTWSADGQWLYLTSNRAGRSEIWRVVQ
jgi:Tol biopolymer transport system component